MQTDTKKEEHYIDKSEWAPGPWHQEPDKIEWRHNGLPCLIVRGPSGALCGYVGVPPGHPWHGADGGVGEPGLDVHGGITYGDRCQADGKICHVARPGEPDDVWWLGFDCAHYGDAIPSRTGDWRLMGTYKDIAYVRREVERLAEMVKTAR